MEEEDNGGNWEAVQPPNKSKRLKVESDPLEGLNTIKGTTRYAQWTKVELEEECRRRRLSIKGGVEGMTGRLMKEDRQQPRLHFKTQGDKMGAMVLDNAQRSDRREEGGGGDRGGSWLYPGEVEEAQWEDIPNRGEDEADGSETREAHLSPRRKINPPGRNKPSPRRNRRGFWLGRKSKLLGEASKKQNNK